MQFWHIVNLTLTEPIQCNFLSLKCILKMSCYWGNIFENRFCFLLPLAIMTNGFIYLKCNVKLLQYLKNNSGQQINPFVKLSNFLVISTQKTESYSNPHQIQRQILLNETVIITSSHILLIECVSQTQRPHHQRQSSMNETRLLLRLLIISLRKHRQVFI